MTNKDLVNLILTKGQEGYSNKEEGFKISDDMTKILNKHIESIISSKYKSLMTEVEIREKLKELNNQRDYLVNFMGSIYKGSDLNRKIDTELKVLNKEINVIAWILNDELPF